MFIQKVIIPQPIFAQEAWKDPCVVGDVATIQGFECLFQNILKVIIPIAGLAFFTMLLIGGFKYLSSGGDPKRTAVATHTITMAFFGIIGVILSWLILLLIQNFTGIKITDFSIPS